MPCRHPISCTCIAHPKLDLLNLNGRLTQNKSKICHRTHAVVLLVLDLCTTLVCSLPLSNPETAVHVDTVHVTILGLLQALDVEASIFNKLSIWRYNGSRPPDYKTTGQHLQYSTSASRYRLACSVHSLSLQQRSSYGYHLSPLRHILHIWFLLALLLYVQ